MIPAAHKMQAVGEGDGATQSNAALNQKANLWRNTCGRKAVGRRPNWLMSMAAWRQCTKCEGCGEGTTTSQSLSSRVMSTGNQKETTSAAKRTRYDQGEPSVGGRVGDGKGSATTLTVGGGGGMVKRHARRKAVMRIEQSGRHACRRFL